jgi:hypothetical protein
MAHSEAVRKLLEHLQSDLKNISLEAKRRHPGVKESAEEAIVKAGNSLQGCRTSRMMHVSPFSGFQGCQDVPGLLESILTRIRL